MKNYGKYLKEIRIENNLSQNELSRKTGISQQLISYWESNKGIPNINFIEIIADFYGITIDELIGREYRETTKNINQTFNFKF